MPSRNERDSYQPRLSTLDLIFWGERITIPTHDYVESIATEFSQSGGGKITITLFDHDQDVLEDLILGGGGAIAQKDNPALSRLFELRFGDDTGDINDLLLFKGIITGYEPSYMPEGTRITLHATNTGIVGAALDKKTREVLKGERISDAVIKIAKERGWDYVIEPTDGLVQEPLNNGARSDIAFIKEELVKRSVNKDKQGFVFYFDNLSRLHFHSQGWGAAPKDGTSVPLSAEYLYGRDAAGSVITFNPSDNALATALWGAGTARYVGVDSKDGTQQNVKVGADSSPVNASVPTVGGGVLRPVISGGLQARIPVNARSQEEFQQIVASRWSLLASATYQADLEVKGTHKSGIGDYIRVKKLRKDGREHYHSGVFMVIGVDHDFGSGGWTTKYKLTRPGVEFTEAAVTSASVKTKTAEAAVSQDPGQSSPLERHDSVTVRK